MGLLRIFPTLRRLYGLMGTNGGCIRDEQLQVGASRGLARAQLDEG